MGSEINDVTEGSALVIHVIHIPLCRQNGDGARSHKSEETNLDIIPPI